MRLNCIKDSENGFFRLEAYVEYKDVMTYKPWPAFLIDTGSLDTYLTTCTSVTVNGLSIPLKGMPGFETEDEKTKFLEQYPIDPDQTGYEGQLLVRRKAESAKLTFLNEKGIHIAAVNLPKLFLAPLPSNVLGLDAIQRLGELCVRSGEAYFELYESALL